MASFQQITRHGFGLFNDCSACKVIIPSLLYFLYILYDAVLPFQSLIHLNEFVL